MPKPTNLHAKQKPTSIQKPVNIDYEGSDSVDPEESLRQFQLELCWCIQQLEKTLGEKKGNEKQLQEAWKILTVLKNNSQPIIRKRQLMRTHFGDYRGKMAAEEKKLAKMTSKIKISEAPVQPKATFLRKSAFLSTGDDTFRFNFHLTPEKMKTGNPSNESNTVPTDNKKDNTEHSNTKTSNSTSNINTAESSSKKFKFTFSDSEFKFNFNADNS